MPHRTLNLTEAAAYLHIAPPDIERLVKDDEIPFARQGTRVVFRKKDIDAWASQRILRFPETPLAAYHRRSSAKLHDLSRKSAIVAQLARCEFFVPTLPSRTKPSVLRDLVKAAAATGLVMSPDDLLVSLEERECLCSTAMPGGFALIHPRHHDPYMFDDSFIVVAKAVQPIHFGAPDGTPTRVFFLICCQDDKIHLHVLARLCMMCSRTDVLARIGEAAAALDMCDAIVRSEQQVIRLTDGT